MQVKLAAWKNGTGPAQELVIDLDDSSGMVTLTCGDVALAVEPFDFMAASTACSGVLEQKMEQRRRQAAAFRQSLKR